MAKTLNFGFEFIDFDTNPWHLKQHDNLRMIDAVLQQHVSITNMQGVWSTALTIAVGDKYVDADQGTVWEANIAHTSASSGTFATDRANNPSYWTIVTSHVVARGAWAASTAYAVNDFVYSGSIHAVCITAHTSSSAFATDSAKWGYLANLTSDVAAAAASATAAAASAASLALPTLTALNYMRANAGATAWENRTPAETLSDIGAQASHASLTKVAGITVTDAGVALLDDADASAQRTTLGLGTLAVQNTIGNSDIDNNSVDGTQIAVGSDAIGDIMYYDGTDWVILAAGTSGFFLEAKGAAAPVWAANPVVQVVNVMDGAVATGTTVLPDDDTIPQKTEGDEYMTLAITPNDASNLLKIEVVTVLANTAAGQLSAALFQDTTANALGVATQRMGNIDTMITVSFTHYMTAGTTSATTFKVRAGGSNAGTTTFNGSSSARKMGGVMSSSITITELRA